MPPPKSPAYWFCVDLVAFLAEADGAIGVDAARLYMELIRALTALPARETLVGHAFCKTALEARDAAEAYFSHVLDDTLAPFAVPPTRWRTARLRWSWPPAPPRARP